jgi:hypothetical protein
MSYSDRLDRLERAMGGDDERRFCGPWGHRCADPEAPHDEFTINIGALRGRAEDDDKERDN